MRKYWFLFYVSLDVGQLIDDIDDKDQAISANIFGYCFVLELPWSNLSVFLLLISFDAISIND